MELERPVRGVRDAQNECGARWWEHWGPGLMALAHVSYGEAMSPS